MNIVRHGPSDIVGICTSDTKPCNRRRLKKSELALYRIDHKKLAAKIAEAIAFTEQHFEAMPSESYESSLVVNGGG